MVSGILFAVLSGLCNGLFSSPMKLANQWKWENTWFGFIIVACLAMPIGMVGGAGINNAALFASSPRPALIAALTFGFLWGFGAICFGRSVQHLGVSVANTLVIGLSSALGSLVPLLLSGQTFGNKQTILLGGIGMFLVGVVCSGRGGAIRDQAAGETSGSSRSRLPSGYLYAVGSGVMSAIFNIGYSLALPISDAGVALGYSRFASTNCIWLLMLGAGAIPNLVYCYVLMKRNRTLRLLTVSGAGRSWALSATMGLLWGGSIFLYGLATPLLGSLGPSVGWPLSLAVGLIVANSMGVLLGEWKDAGRQAIVFMQSGLAALFLAIVLCAYSARMDS